MDRFIPSSVLDDIHAAHPEKLIMSTESSINTGIIGKSKLSDGHPGLSSAKDFLVLLSILVLTILLRSWPYSNLSLLLTVHTFD